MDHVWGYTPKFNIAPENWWLEDYFPIGKVTFQGQVVTREGMSVFILFIFLDWFCWRFLRILPFHGMKNHLLQETIWGDYFFFFPAP